MVRAFALSTRVNFTISCNFVIYYLKKLPWLGKKIPDSLYGLVTAKFVLSILLEMLKGLFGFLGTALSLGIFIYGPIFLMEGDLLNLDLFYHYFFVVYFWAGPFMNSIILQARDIKAYTMINILKLPRRDYFVSKVIYTLGIKTVRYLLLLLLMSLFTGITVLESLMLAGYILFAALLWEYLLLKSHAKFKINIYDKIGLVLALLALLLLLCYLPPYLGFVLSLQGLLTNGFVFVLMAGLAGLSLWGLYRFDGYSAVTKDTLSRERLLGIEDIVKNAAFADVNLAEEKLAKEDVNGADELQGYPLFNHLFFARNRRIIEKPVRSRVVSITVGTLLIWGVLLFSPDLRSALRENLLSWSPYFVFVMYLLSTGERFSRALFFNCDRYMLKEMYYRDKSALLENFTVRLKKSIKLNLVPATGVAILLLGIGVIIGMGPEIYRLLPLVVTLFSLAMFFSTHYLFIYYMLQPYTADLTKKSPLYFLINWLVYVISYAMIFIKTASLVFTLGVLFFTLLYTALAIFLTYKIAHRTFKLR